MTIEQALFQLLLAWSVPIGLGLWKLYQERKALRQQQEERLAEVEATLTALLENLNNTFTNIEERIETLEKGNTP